MVPEVEGRAGLQARPREAAARIVRRVATLVAALFAGLLGAASAAFASTTTDPTGGVFTQAQSQFSQYIIPGAVGIVLLVLIFGVAVMWARRTAKRS